MSAPDGMEEAGEANGSEARGPELHAPSLPRQAPSKPEWTRRGLATFLAGALVTGGMAAGTLALISSAQTFEVDQIAPADLDGAATSFPRAELGTHIDDAKACRVPLFFVTLVPRNGSSGHVRIRSGDYWTPVIRLGSGPIKVALPYPSPYPTGIGSLGVEGDNAAFDIYLHPGWVGHTVQSSDVVHIWWRVRSPC